MSVDEALFAQHHAGSFREQRSEFLTVSLYESASPGTDGVRGQSTLNINLILSSGW